jgi:predicted DNA binding CopG/RHH family protein
LPNLKLDDEEQLLLEDFERGELVSVATREQLDLLRQAAHATALKDRRVNIRLSSADLQAIQAKALADGLPYQTLIASVLHKYAAGTLRETSIDREKGVAVAVGVGRGKSRDLTP